MAPATSWFTEVDGWANSIATAWAPSRAGSSGGAGTWERTEGNKTTVEHWLPHAGTTIMGLSHTHDSKRTHFFEFMRIATHGGRIAYIVQPGGDSPVLFRAVKVTEEEAVFENPEHDHPQRFRYVKTEGGMTATISSMDGSKATEFAFERRAE